MAVSIAQLLGEKIFADMTSDDVEELLEACSDHLTDDDLMEMTENAYDEEEEEQPEVLERENRPHT